MPVVTSWLQAVRRGPTPEPRRAQVSAFLSWDKQSITKANYLDPAYEGGLFHLSGFPIADLR